MTNPLRQEQRFGANNYDSLPVTLVRGRGVYVWDNHGMRYLDMMSAYSSVSHGHGHPRLRAALYRQAGRLSVVSRAFRTDRLGPFLARACELTGQEAALPMNTGTEAVETALKAARKWAYREKGVAPGKANIIVCDGNFHGRTITIVGFSGEARYRDGFGPFPEGFIRIPYGDSDALARAITSDTAAFLVEPVQGEGGIVFPPNGYLKECERVCRARNVLLICDEVQTGLGRTGDFLAGDHERVKPDGVILGKALGGGMLPVSLFLTRRAVMDVFEPGTHGSTFGGNPLASAVGLEALNVIQDEGLVDRSRRLGHYMLGLLQRIRSPLIRDIRGRGLFIGVDIDPRLVSARTVCEQLLHHGVLTADTHETVVRLAPPLVITKAQIDTAVRAVSITLEELNDAHAA